MRELRTAAIAVLAFTLVLGLALPLLMTGVSQVVFPGRADGSMVEVDGKVVGSTLVGQDFSRDTGRKEADGDAVLEPDLRYFQSRPSVTGHSPSATFFNNQGPNQRELADQIEGYVDAYVKRERPYSPGLAPADVPADAATTSASGVDPHISEDNARIQANRVAEERGIDRDRVLAMIGANASRPLLGLAGPRSINVLALNLTLDRKASR